MKKLLLTLSLALCAFSADAPKPAAPPAPPVVWNDLRADILQAQRDFIMADSDVKAAQARKDAAQQKFQAKYVEAGVFCQTKKQIFDPTPVQCVVDPNPAPVPAKGESK